MLEIKSIKDRSRFAVVYYNFAPGWRIDGELDAWLMRYDT